MTRMRNYGRGGGGRRISSIILVQKYSPLTFPERKSFHDKMTGINKRVYSNENNVLHISKKMKEIIWVYTNDRMGI